MKYKKFNLRKELENKIEGINKEFKKYKVRESNRWKEIKGTKQKLGKQINKIQESSSK